MENKIFDLFKKIGLSISMALVLSLLIIALTKVFVIRIIASAVLFVGICLFLFFKRKKLLLPIAIPFLIGTILAYVLPAGVVSNIALVIVSCLILVVVLRNVPSNFKPVAFIILFVALLTWVLPISYFSEELVSEGKNQLGLFDLLSYPSVTISYFGNNFLYLLAIGGFYGVLYKTGAFRTVLENLVKKVKGKEKLLVAFLIVAISLLVAVCGASFGMWMIIPFVIALILMLGYDKITAAIVTIGSISLGIMGNLFSSTFIATDYSMTAQSGAGVINNILGTNPKSLLLPKIIILLLGMVILIIAAFNHMKKSKAETSAEVSEYVPEEVDKKQKSKKVWPLILVFDLTFLVMLLSLTSWTSVFKINAFTKATEFVLSKVTVSSFPIIGKILGAIKPFEQWGLVELSILLVVASYVISKIYKINFSEYVDGFMKGAKKAFKPALLVVLAFTTLIIVSYNPITLTILKPILTLTKNFNVFTSSLAAFIASVLNVDIYYIAYNCLQYAQSVSTGASSSLVALVWYSMYGFATLIAPTSLTLVAVLSYLNIPYKKWLKSNWIFIVGILALMLIVFTGCVLILK